MEERATLDQVESAIGAIREKYDAEFYPFEVRESGGGWQFLTKGSFHKTVALLNGDKFLKRLSTAALETLAIIAYKQPITKGEIENIRGVNCDYAVQKLLEKELVNILGRKEDAPGHPLIYGTSKTFMDYFGINSPEELPKLSDLVPHNPVMPTTVGEAHPADEDLTQEEVTEETEELQMVVNASGDIEMLADETSAEQEMNEAESPVDESDQPGPNEANEEGNLPDENGEEKKDEA
jgi:segregation and condensation protein B